MNDAVLATRLDAVEEAVRSLADKALSKWNVATIVFATIGGLGASVGLRAGVVKIAAS